MRAGTGLPVIGCGGWGEYTIPGAGEWLISGEGYEPYAGRPFGGIGAYEYPGFGGTAVFTVEIAGVGRATGALVEGGEMAGRNGGLLEAEG